MKLLFIINNFNGWYIDSIETGVANLIKRRAVEIELTPEQIKKLGIRKIGIVNGKEIYETIESISLSSQENNIENK